jgi:hypothetical protein
MVLLSYRAAASKQSRELREGKPHNIEPLQLLDSLGPHTGYTEDVADEGDVLFAIRVELLGIRFDENVVGAAIIDAFELCALVVQMQWRRIKSTERVELLKAPIFALGMAGEL